MPGTLEGDAVLVREQPEANRIHNKGHFGRAQSGGGLRLDLLEACYLAEAGRLAVERDGTALAWTDLLLDAGRRRPGFEIHYLAYRDLRERGFLVRASPPAEAKAGADFVVWPRGTTRPGAPEAWMAVASERTPFDLAATLAFARAGREGRVAARICIVDEESDLTYYELTDEAPKGPVTAHRLAGPARAVLLADRVMVEDAAAAAALHRDEFFGKAIGERLHLSLVEALHLLGRGDLALRDGATGRDVSAAALRRRARELEPAIDLRHRVYEDLKGRGLIVKTGFKFGTHFRAYEDRPEASHAPHLVQAVPSDWTAPWEPVARAVRLAHSVRKRLRLAAPTARGVEYLTFGRFRP